jgi:hypothetical protein
MKRIIIFRPMLWLALLGCLLVALSGSCAKQGGEVNQGGEAKQGDEVKQAGAAIRQHAARSNPAFRTGRLRFSGTLGEVGGGGDVCICIQVCNSKGENCTACSCSPASCGTC